MKKKLLALFSLCLALLVFCLPFSFCLEECNHVSAADFGFPETAFQTGVDQSLYNSFLSDLKSNSSFKSNFSDSSIVCFNRRSSDLIVFIIDPVGFYDFPPVQWLRDGLRCYWGNYYLGFISPSDLSSFSFTSVVGDPSLNQVRLVVPENYDFSGFSYSIGYDSTSSYSPSSGDSLMALYSVSNAFNPEYEVVSLPFFSLDVDGFYEWIINNNKLSELPSYIVQAKLKSFIEFYKSFGSSNTFFISKIADWFSHMNIANQSISNISALKSATDKLYQEYINYRSGTHAYWPNATKIQERNDIDTHTDNNNTTLITDDTNDSVDTSILRDILRGVIAISNNINQVGSNIIQKLEQLDFTVNVTNDGGSGVTINNTLQFLFVPTFNGFSEFETDLYEKFPFIAELEDLPEIEDYLQESEPQRSEVVPLFRAGASGSESNDSGDPLKTREDLFEFSVPSNSTFLNGSVSGLSINFASFTKLGIAIECFKGIISVLAIFGFSHWLIKFVPKLLAGFASND